MKTRSILILAAFFLYTLPSSFGQWQKYDVEKIKIAAYVGAADFNGDNKPDLYMSCDTEESTNVLHIYENDFPFWIKRTIANSPAPFMYHADLDDDGKLDIIGSEYFGGKLVWYKNIYPDWEKITIDPSTNSRDEVMTADINQDGKLDIITAPPGPNYKHPSEIVWYENNQPEWTRHNISAPISGGLFFIYDMDFNGSPEIIYAADTANDLLIYSTPDKGVTWDTDTVDDNLIYAYGPCAGDLDGDGVTDLVVATGGFDYPGKEVVWYKKIDNVWIKHIIDSELNGGYTARIVDVDGDGTMDVIANGFSANDIVWYENKHPEWIKHIIDGNMIAPRKLTIADIDGDNVLDVVAPGMATMSWYKNPFTPVASLTTMDEYEIDMSAQGLATQTFSGTMVNPENHEISVSAVIKGDQTGYKDTIPAYDDGSHGDLTAGDNVWSTELSAEELPEDAFNFGFISYDSVSDLMMGCPETARILTFGPLAYNGYNFTTTREAFNPGKNTSIKILLDNQSTTAAATGIRTMLVCDDRLVTIARSYKEFDDIPAGETGETKANHMITIFEDCPRDTTFVIDVQISFEKNVFWTDTFHIRVTWPVAIEKKQPAACKIYPNPGNELLSIEAPYNDHHSIEIYSLSGRLVYQKEMDGRSAQLDLSALSKGAFFINIRSMDYIWTEKLIRF